MMYMEWGNDKARGQNISKGRGYLENRGTTNFRTRKDGTEIQNRYTKKWLDKNNLEYKRFTVFPQ